MKRKILIPVFAFLLSLLSASQIVLGGDTPPPTPAADTVVPEAPPPADAVTAAQEKRLLGTVTGLLQGEKDLTQLFVADRDNVSNTILVSPATPIKKQVDLTDIKQGEFAAVIFEEEEGKRLALSTSVGAPEKVEMEKEELLKFAPKPEAPKAPQVPQAPEVPPVPQAGGQQAGAPPGGQAVDKSKEATGFSPEEAAKAKAKEKEKKNPLEDVLSQEGPLSEAGEGPPPSFVSGKIVSIDLKAESPSIVLQDSSGKEMPPILLGPHLQIVNRYLDVASLSQGNKVDILYEEREKDKIAKAILVARDSQGV